MSTRLEDEAPWSDHRIEQIIGRLLQVGVILAAMVVLAGGTLLLAQYGGAPARFEIFRAESATLRTFGGMMRGAAALESRALVQLGLVLLIATPVARVFLTLVAFARQGDRLYVAITALVLGLLLFGLFGGQV